MKKSLYILPYIVLLLLVLTMYSCASIGMPSGGARDEDPPRFVRSSPAPYSTNVKGNRIDIEFDELVNVKDAFTNVVVSPPAASVPKVLSSGRKIYVQWDDTLRSNTTYNIDFGTSIVDVNEGNPLGNYSFIFSTGPDIDSLRMSGIVLDAASLEPQQGMLVGVHPADAPDSAFRTLRFERVTKTDDRGRFVLRGLRHIPYSLFALGDLNNDYRWDNPAELIAFYPKSVTPYAESGIAHDTIYNLLTGAVDTVVTRDRTVFRPDNLLLSVFDTGYKSQYLVKYERPDSLRLNFIFNAASTSLPHIAPVDFIPSSEWYVMEHSLGNDTVTFWLMDKHIVATDSLRVALSYERDDKDRNRVVGMDTLLLTRPKVKSVAKTNKKKTAQEMARDSIEAEKQRWLQVKIGAGSSHNVEQPVLLTINEPLLALDTLGVHLEILTDTIWEEMAMPPILQDTTGSIRNYSLSLPRWQYGAKYRITVDSLAMQGITGRYNKELKQEFSIKKREDYAQLTLRLSPDTIPGFVEVLNTSDKPVARAWVEHGTVTFPYLAPAEYYVRFIAHSGDKMEFTTGDYDKGQQPDEVFYYPRQLSLKRHDRSEQWNLYGTPVDMQKPDAIKKNKPVVKKVSKPRKGESTGGDNEEDDYFDVNRNPFDNTTRKQQPR